MAESEEEFEGVRGMTASLIHHPVPTKKIIKEYEVGERVSCLIKDVLGIPALLERIAELEAENRELQSKVYLGENKIMANFVVKDDNPSVNYTIAVGEVKDAEGNVIPDAQVDVEVLSDNEASVAVTPGADGRSGSVAFGSPGEANFTVNAKSGGVTLATHGDHFLVTTGDPASIADVSVSFDGLTPTGS